METSGNSSDIEFRESINLHHYWRVLVERRWLVIATLVSIVVLSLIYLYKAPRVFQAVSRLEIDRESDNVMSFKDVFAMDAREQDYLQTQYKKLQSRSLIEAVVKSLGLERDPRYAGKRDIAKAVSDDIQIAPIRLSRLVDIKVNHTNAQQAALIANALVGTFITNNLDLKMTRSLEALEWLKVEANSLRTNVLQADLALEDYKSTNKMLALDDSQNIVLQSLKEIQTDYNKLRAEAEIAKAGADKVDELLKAKTPRSEIPQVANHPSINEPKKTLAEEEAKLAGLRTRYKGKYPDVIESSNRVVVLRQKIDQQSAEILGSIRAEADIAMQKAAAAQAQLDQIKGEQAGLNKLRIKYDELAREASKYKAIYDSVLARMRETELTGKIKTNNMQVVDSAKVPLRPIRPNTWLVVMLGIVGGFAGSLSLAFFVNYLDDSVKSQDDVESYLGLPFLGYVPHIRTANLVERDLHSHLFSTSTAAEAFRTVRAAISLSNLPEKLKTVVVTSTVPSEGKSLVAANFAIVSAQSDLHTLLVEADLRRPSVHKVFKLHSPLGMATYLQNKVQKIDDIIHHTDIPNLDAICCGAIPNSPSELVGSSRMQHFLQEVAQKYDRVVLDCPPISAVSDPLVVAAMANGLIFVTEFNKIRRELARKTIQRVQNAGIHIFGAVINNIDFEGRDSYYYAYYQNRYYESHYKTKAQPQVSSQSQPLENVEK